MVERVALAIKAELGRQMDARPLVDSQPGDWYSAKGGEVELEQVVRVAFAAMREPTEAMVSAAPYPTMHDRTGKGIDPPPSVCWTRMIDAALK